MKLKNFRQFYGQQEISFSAENENKNVTLIYGENGRGKTGLYRALMFCLYGEKKLAQDGEDTKKEISLVNKIALEEAGNSSKAEAYVEVSFEHGNESYILKRCMIGMLDDGDEYEQTTDACLTIVRTDGNAQTFKKTDEINSIVNTVLDKRVREYFLFDGEKIERLTRTTRAQKKEIETGIKNLLNIDELIVARKAIALCLKNLEDDLQKESSGEHQQTLLELKKKEEKKDDLSGQLELISCEIDKADEQISELNNKLAKFEGISAQIKRRQSLEELKDSTYLERDEILKEMITVNDDVGMLLIFNEMVAVDSVLSDMVTNNKIPSLIREQLITELLNSGICICGRDLKRGEQAYDKLLAWKNETMDQVVEDSLLHTHSEIGRTVEYINNRIEKVQQCLQGYSGKSQDLDRIDKELDDISKEIGTIDIGDEDIPQLERTRHNSIKEKGRLEQKHDDIKKKIELLDDEIKLLEKKMKELNEKQSRTNLLAKRSMLVRDAKDAIDSIYDQFTVEIRKNIGDHASGILQEIIDDQGKKTFKRVEVSDDYSLQLIDWRDKPFLANISAGQRQILSISFIAALAQVAGHTKILEMPLFMDTPFGRLSQEHRSNLISNIPELARQWVLLATDTEFTDFERGVLQKTKRWGKAYILKSEEPFKTVISEVSIKDFQN